MKQEINIALSFIAIALITVVGFNLEKAIDKMERIECLQWQEQAQEFPNYYVTQWQEAQCEAQEVDIWEHVQL